MSRPRYYVEVNEPELGEELRRVRASWAERTGRPGFQLRGTLFDDEEEAIAFARSRHAEGLDVSIHVRYMISDDEEEK